MENIFQTSSQIRDERGRFIEGIIVWNKGKKMDKEYGLRISDALKGRSSSILHRKNIGKGLRGHKVSKETKEKISKAQRGKKKNWSKEGEKIVKTHWIGKKHSIKTRKKMSESHKGENSSLWRGGVTLENKIIRTNIEFRLWRESVFARDNWICQKCKSKSGDGRAIYLEAHHIQNFAQFPELRFAIDNGITLCKNCHRKFHNKYSRKNNTKEQIKEFLE